MLVGMLAECSVPCLLEQLRMDARSPRRPSLRGLPGRGGASSGGQSSQNASASGSAAPQLSLAAVAALGAAGPSTSTDVTPAVDQDATDTGGDYEVLHFIGRGKFSQVFVARDRRNGRLVVLKKVQIFEIMDNRARNDCIREVRMLQSLHHVNIVECYTSFMENNELNIVLEWAEAGDLANILRMRREQQQPFTIPEVLYYFQQLCEALQHMHANRIMHRDLKPSNVFVTAAGVLKVGDLGLSRHFSSQTDNTQSMVGTPYYMSPECIRGMPYSFSSDIWSLGCLLYELITLRNPFQKEGLNFYLLGKLITSGRYDPLPPTCPPFLSHLVSCMLKQDASLRPEIGAVLHYLRTTPPAPPPAQQ